MPDSQGLKSHSEGTSMWKTVSLEDLTESYKRWLRWIVDEVSIHAQNSVLGW